MSRPEGRREQCSTGLSEFPQSHPCTTEPSGRDFLGGLGKGRKWCWEARITKGTFIMGNRRQPGANSVVKRVPQMIPESWLSLILQNWIHSLPISKWNPLFHSLNVGLT